MDGKATTFGYDGNGNQVWKRERPGFVTQETSYGYDGDNRLRTVKVPVGPVRAAVEQWGATATASSAYGTGTASWAASQATGAPNVAGCTSSGQAWAPSSSTPGQWLEVGYAAPAKAVGVRIHETGTAGTVTKVELVDEGGTAHQVWAGSDGTLCGQWLEVKLPETAYRVAKVKLTTKAQTHVDAVSLVSEPAAGPTATVGYEYDANGLRTRRSDAAGVTSYLLDGLSVVGTYDASGAQQAWYTQSPARIDEVLNVSNVQGKYWYQADALGSIYALTTASGAVQARGGYDVFGEPVAQGGTPVGQPYGFTGREHEVESGLVYARARYLNPGTGAWTAADPLTQSVTRSGALGAEPWLRVLGGGLPIPGPEASRYGYIDARPTVGVDPSGLMVIYVGLGATAAVPGSGFTFGAGVAQGGYPFSYALGLTAGFATQVYKLVNVGLSVDFSLFWGFEPDEACSIRGPFMTLSADPGLGASVSMVWSITWEKLLAFTGSGIGADFSAALGPPVGLTLSPGLLPTSWLPAAGVTWFATWSWIPYSINCRCN